MSLKLRGSFGVQFTCRLGPGHTFIPACSWHRFTRTFSQQLQYTNTSTPNINISTGNQTVIEMSPFLKYLLGRWHRVLGLQRHPKTWYRDRLREELSELRAAESPIAKLSESSDVFYTLSRSRHSGYPTRSLPSFSVPRHALVYAYLVGKYTSRWTFYRVAARLSASSEWRSVRECVNSARDSKTVEVAARNDIDPTRFRLVCQRLRRWWPLFP